MIKDVCHGYLLFPSPIFFYVLHHITFLTQLSLPHLKYSWNWQSKDTPHKTHFKLWSHHNRRQSSLKLLLQSIQLIQADLGNSTQVFTSVRETLTSVSPLFNIPVYLGHSGASISFSSKGKSFRSTDSPFPLTYESIHENVKHNRAVPFQACPLPFPW